jgi:hypothetical protein
MANTTDPRWAASERLAYAAATGVPVAPVRDLPGADLGAAYETQELAIRSREGAGIPPVGRKVGSAVHFVPAKWCSRAPSGRCSRSRPAIVSKPPSAAWAWSQLRPVVSNHC